MEIHENKKDNIIPEPIVAVRHNHDGFYDVSRFTTYFAFGLHGRKRGKKKGNSLFYIFLFQYFSMSQPQK